MLNKKIILSSLSIMTTLAMMTGATFAYFSDTGTSSNNTFSTGSLALKLANGENSPTDNVTATFGNDALVPGTCTGPQTLQLRNEGTIAADHAEVHLTSNTVTDANDDASPDMDSFLRINSLTYDGSDVLTQISNENGNGYKDLADWTAAANAGALDNLALTDQDTNHPLVMDVCLDSSAGNQLQGDSVVSTFSIDLNQHSSQ